jgi:Methyltransferase domain
MNEAGFRTNAYDPFFADDESLLSVQYDFIACSETAEHFRDPASSWRLLASLLLPGGIIGVMTEWHRGQTPISSWRYARDPTHVSFYCRETFQFLAELYGFVADFPRENVCLLERPG